MELTVGIREIIAWAIALISLTIAFSTRIRNPTQQSYMAVQGLLVACHKKATFYAAQAQALRESKSSTSSLSEAQKIYEFVSNDYAVLAQYTFSVMKAIQPKDLPVDVVTFLASEQHPLDSPNPSEIAHSPSTNSSVNPAANGIPPAKQLIR